ncbi:spindle pole body component [Niveomyces insectorum RCEF 264]|uniref:Spindle pole body component n=1 Tax=Niveomyces insectorum RCEF 264 TaxID=1081102 RepID=A0A167QV51_9HYPO|nr:spindle pole body component [Niveomyces insectorum RCEF 264]
MAIVSRAEAGQSLAVAKKDKNHKCEVPPFSKKLEYAIHMYSLQAVLSVPLWIRGWKEYFTPPPGGPDIVKAYECRPALPIRIFFPADYDQTSPKPLPSVFTIHGGGFCIGVNRDDDEYNRDLADTHRVLVVSMNYSKSPAVTFPVALYDLEALYHALDMLAHESWRLACRLGNEAARAHGEPATREVPDPDSKVDRVKCVGKRASSKRKGVLEPPGDERYGWQATWPDGSVNWLLVPDAVHGFDNFNIRQVMGGEETMLDAEMKTKAYVKLIGEWLHNVVWSIALAINEAVWKVRKQAYEDAAKQFALTPDEYDPAFRPFLQDTSLWKSAVADSNVAAQQEGIAALCAFLQYGGREACLRTRGHTINALVEKGLASTRAATKASALEALLLYIELDVAAPIVEDILPSLSAKQPKVVAASLAALTTIYHSYGCKIVDPKPVLKFLPKAFGHADKNVRAEATKLTVEFYRWLREAMKPMFWGDLKPTQQAELEGQFEQIKAANEPPKQERLLRTQQAAQAKAAAAAAAAGGGGHGGDGGDGYYDGADGDGAHDDEPAEIDTFDLAEPQDVLKSVPANFHDNLASSKWKERKEAVDALYAVLNVPRIKDGDFNEINRGLAKCMKDANIAVVTQAANCIEVLAKGLRSSYGRYRTVVMQPIMERLKEKKQSVADALGAALDQVFLATSLSECLEDIIAFQSHKNPQVKEGTMRFLVRCLRTTRDVPSKQEIASIVESAKKLLAESSEGLRSGGAEVLGTVMKIIGERAMNPHLEGLDEIRKTKVKEFFETAEVKAKEKPKAAPPPPRPAAAAGRGPPKKVVNGTAAQKKAGPSPLKRPGAAAAAAPPPRDEPLAPQPTSRPKLGGLKSTSLQKRTIGGPSAMSPRRGAPPPASPTFEDDPPAPSTPVPPQSRMGPRGGGLASRSLAKPGAAAAAAAAAAAHVAPPASPTPMSNLTELERAEFEELRAANYRLLRQADEARHERSKMVSEIQELKNQNAGLIEDHTRDVLSIKAKETQLVRARSDAEAAEQTNERLRRELDRLKRALSKAEATLAANGSYASGGGGGGGSGMNSPGFVSPTHDDAGIYRDGGYPPSAHNRHRMSFASTLSEEKENGEAAAAYPRSKLSPDLRYAAVGSTASSGRGSPARGFRRDLGATGTAPSGHMDDGGSSSNGYSGNNNGSSGGGGGGGGGGSNGSHGGGSSVTGQESWKRAAEVTNQLKARIEQMKAKQGIKRG